MMAKTHTHHVYAPRTNWAPKTFVRPRWTPFVFTDDGIDRRYCELCVLAELKNAPRSGDLLVQGSRQLAEMTPARVQEWKRSFLVNAGSDPLSLRRARISVNSLLRQARSLFATKRIRYLQLSLPNPLPFDGVDFEPRQSMKYRSELLSSLSVKPSLLRRSLRV
jgi:hypothetical protein